MSIVGIDILPTCIHSKFYGRDQGMPSHVLSKRDFLSSQHCILTTLHTHITCDYIHKLLVTIIKKHDNKFSCKFYLMSVHTKSVIILALVQAASIDAVPIRLQHFQNCYGFFCNCIISAKAFHQGFLPHFLLKSTALLNMVIMNTLNEPKSILFTQRH